MHIVITGGARGIGAAAVEHFSKKGYDIAFFYEKNHEAAQALAERTNARAMQVDVSDAEQVKNAFARLRPVDTLLCSAGLAHMGLISDVDEAQWDRLFAVNVKGVYHCVRAALPNMLKVQRGNIITIASMWGRQAPPVRWRTRPQRVRFWH